MKNIIIILLLLLIYSCSETKEIKDVCKNINCSNKGICKTETLTGNPFCDCDEGFKAKELECVTFESNCTDVVCEDWKVCQESTGKCVLKEGRCEENIDCKENERCDYTLNCIDSTNECFDVLCSFNGFCNVENNVPVCTCYEGFEQSEDKKDCVDIDECLTNNVSCGENQICTNYIGYFSCDCISGYKFDDSGICKELNECLDGSHNCNQYAYCENTIGSFTCQCYSGFTGDGINCEDINECENENNNDCGNYCTNTKGSYFCGEVTQFGTDKEDISYSIKYYNEFIYLTGSTNGEFKDNTFFGEKDVFVAKYDLNENLIWVKQFGTPAFEEGRGIDVDETGNVYVTGFTYGSLEENVIPFCFPDYCTQDAFIAKLNNNGNIEWIKQFGTTQLSENEGSDGTDMGLSIKTKDSFVYISGVSNGNIDDSVNVRYFDILLAKYSTNGEKVFIKTIGSLGSDYGYDLTVDNFGNIIIAGTTTGNFGENTNAGCYDEFNCSSDILIVKTNSNGEVLQLSQKGTIEEDELFSVTTDESNNIYVTGFTMGSFENYINQGGLDIIVSKLNSEGDFEWISQFGTNDGDEAKDILIANNNIYIAGCTLGSFENRINRGFFDMFVAKINLNGFVNQIKQIGDAFEEIAYSFSTDNTGNMFITGTTSQSGLLDSVILTIETF